MRQPKTSQRAYKETRRPLVKCGVCGSETREYRPVVINNRPMWACTAHN